MTTRTKKRFTNHHTCGMCGFKWQMQDRRYPRDLVDYEERCECCSWSEDGTHLEQVAPGVFEVIVCSPGYLLAVFRGSWIECRDHIDANGGEEFGLGYVI